MGAIQSLYQSGDYASALAFLQNTQLNNKALTAEILNALTDYIVQVEQLNDPNFKADKIQLSRRPPTGMTSGQVYFRWLAPYLFNEVDALGYTFNEVEEKRYIIKSYSVDYGSVESTMSVSMISYYAYYPMY